MRSGNWFVCWKRKAVGRKKVNSWAVTSCAAGSLGLAWIVYAAAGYGGHAVSLLAGWAAAAVMILAGNRAMKWKSAPSADIPVTRPLIFIFLRLIILLILIVIVLVWAFFEAGPFLIGLFSAYFAGVWLEIAWLASGQAEDRNK